MDYDSTEINHVYLDQTQGIDEIEWWNHMQQLRQCNEQIIEIILVPGTFIRTFFNGAKDTT